MICQIIVISDYQIKVLNIEETFQIQASFSNFSVMLTF